VLQQGGSLAQTKLISLMTGVDGEVRRTLIKPGFEGAGLSRRLCVLQDQLGLKPLRIWFFFIQSFPRSVAVNAANSGPLPQLQKTFIRATMPEL
jgi:hypothetical protein